MSKEHILVIDDDKFTQKITIDALSEKYQVSSAFNGEEGVAKAIELKPDYIILDVEMPGMNGYEVCDKLKHEPSTAHIPVVFASSNGQLRDRMQGYEAGGSDYLVKPVDKEVLHAKLAVLHSYHTVQTSLEHRVKEAEKTAYTALSNSAELGQVLSFVEKTYQTHDYQGIGESLINGLKRFNLLAIVRIESKYGNSWFSHKGQPAPLEKEIITLLRKDNKRFHDFGSRTQINYPFISLLIKNMPLDNMENYGRLKDILPVMVGAADAKISIIDTETAIRVQSDEIKHAVSMIHHNLSDVSKSMLDNRSQSRSVLQSTFRELSNHLPSLALEDDQEEYILNTLEKGLNQAHNIINTGDEISENFKQIIASLSQVSEQQSAILEIFLNRSTRLSEEQDPNDKYGADIELF